VSNVLPIDSLSGGPILVIGDLMLDEYIWGDVSRISPEAPVPVVEGRHRELRVGGAGSVVENLATLGVEVQLCSLVGKDEAGEILIEMLSGHLHDLSGVLTGATRATVRKMRVLAGVQHAGRGQQQILRLDWEQVRAPDELESRLLEKTIRGYLAVGPKAVLISDYEKGLLTPQLLRLVIDEGRRAGIPVLVDPGRRVDYDRYRGATLICPNRFEAQRASGLPLDTPEEQIEAGRKLQERLSVDHVVLTLDREGITRVSRDLPHRRFPTRVRAVADVAGAGDMVLALLGLAIASDWDIDDAIGLANIGAGIEVTKVGVSPVESWELRQGAVASALEASSAECSPKDAVKACARVRAGGGSVVFTNGCFDLLHSGHLRLLESARALGDLLVIGLNSDDSVRRIKGSGRPILPVSERARLLGALACVDHVIVFEEDTPLELIKAIEPDVLVKGADYNDRKVVGREVVEGGGGRVELIDLRPGSSTTGLIERIRESGR